MAKGVLKFWILRTISERNATGYQIIKKVEELTGSKPSTGSIYPMLKSMENEGWIKGTKTDDKTIYEITPVGKNKIKEFHQLKMDYLIRIHQSVSLANEAFDEVGYFVYMEHMNVLAPLIHDAVRLLEKGVNPDKISEVISRAVEELNKLGEDVANE